MPPAPVVAAIEEEGDETIPSPSAEMAEKKSAFELAVRGDANRTSTVDALSSVPTPPTAGLAPLEAGGGQSEHDRQAALERPQEWQGDGALLGRAPRRFMCIRKHASYA
jgi:hypothetical protein